MGRDSELLRALISLLVEKGVISWEELESTIDKLREVKLSDILTKKEMADIKKALRQYARNLRKELREFKGRGFASGMYRHAKENELEFIKDSLVNIENLSISEIARLYEILRSNQYENEEVLRKIARLVAF